MPSDYKNYKMAATLPVAHSFLVVLLALAAPHEEVSRYIMWSWLFWPPFLFWRYRSEKVRWILPVGVSCPIWIFGAQALIRA
jgi:hypothetical protein